MACVWLSRASMGWAGRVALGTWWAGPRSALSPIVTELVTSQGSHSVLQVKGELFWTEAGAVRSKAWAWSPAKVLVGSCATSPMQL